MMFDDDTPPWETADNEPVNQTHGWAMALLGIALLALCGYWLAACGTPAEPTATDPPTTITLPASPMPTAPPLLAIEAAPAATATSVAVRVAPPTTDPCAARGLGCLPFYDGPDDLCTEMIFYRQQWPNLTARFDDAGRHQKWTPSDGLGWREAKCHNDALSFGGGCCGGYWQLNIPEFIRKGNRDALALCDVHQLSDVMGNMEDGEANDPVGVLPYNKQRQACVAAWVLSVSGLGAWAPLS